MTTKLTIAVTRETEILVDGRPVKVTLIPGNALTCTPDRVEFHLKGTLQRREINLAACLSLVGWKADKIRAPHEPTHAEQLNHLIDVIERAI